MWEREETRGGRRRRAVPRPRLPPHPPIPAHLHRARQRAVQQEAVHDLGGGGAGGRRIGARGDATRAARRRARDPSAAPMRKDDAAAAHGRHSRRGALRAGMDAPRRAAPLSPSSPRPRTLSLAGVLAAYSVAPMRAMDWMVRRVSMVVGETGGVCGERRCLCPPAPATLPSLPRPLPPRAPPRAPAPPSTSRHLIGRPRERPPRARPPPRACRSCTPTMPLPAPRAGRAVAALLLATAGVALVRAGEGGRDGKAPDQNKTAAFPPPPPASQAVPGDARTLLVTCPIASRTEVRPLSAKSLRPLSAALPPVDDASFIAWAYAVPPAPDAAACAGVEAVPFGVGEGGERVGRGGQAFFGAPRARARRRPRRPLPFSLVPFSSGDTLAIPGSSGASLTRTADAVNVTMAGAAGAVPLPAGAKVAACARPPLHIVVATAPAGDESVQLVFNADTGCLAANAVKVAGVQVSGDGNGLIERARERKRAPPAAAGAPTSTPPPSPLPPPGRRLGRSHVGRVPGRQGGRAAARGVCAAAGASARPPSRQPLPRPGRRDLARPSGDLLWRRRGGAGRRALVLRPARRRALRLPEPPRADPALARRPRAAPDARPPLRCLDDGAGPGRPAAGRRGGRGGRPVPDRVRLPPRLPPARRRRRPDPGRDGAVRVDERRWRARRR